jgi:hypothetical protein
MKETILELISVAFLAFGFVFAEKPILSIGCFATFAVLGSIVVLLKDRKERRIFRK